MTDKPIRIQLRRTKGWCMPPNTVKEARRLHWPAFDERNEL